MRYSLRIPRKTLEQIYSELPNMAQFKRYRIKKNLNRPENNNTIEATK